MRRIWLDTHYSRLYDLGCNSACSVTKLQRVCILWAATWRYLTQSGGDTTLKGTVVAGKKVAADVGGNLNIESLQDSSVYASKDQSIGGSVTVG